jgi:hypothetical protein
MGKSRDQLNAVVKLNNSTIGKIWAACLVIVLISAPGAAFAKKHHHASSDVVKSRALPLESKPLDDTAALARENPDDVSHYSYTLEELGALGPLDLHSVDGRRSLTVSMRNDLVVTAAKLRLAYAWSPALIPELSHLRVLLNDELMSSLPLPRENYNGHVGDVNLDPSMFIDFNKLTLNLIAHYTRDCEDPMHSTLWANVSNQSKLDLTVRHLKLANDLALLPAPFFDRLDNNKLMLPFVFTSQPNNDVLHAAGVVASWFGGLAKYRGAQFPVLLNTLPKGNGVMIVAGNAAPAGLNLPLINGPSIAMIENPLNVNAKLLVIMGRDAKELDIAAQALTLAKATLNGPLVSVKQMDNIPLRKPYDAPAWIPTDRPVHLAELVKQSELQAEGLTPETIKVNFNMPPDIFSWHSEGVPLDLHYRYTPRLVQDRSTLNVNINNLFVQALPLYSVPGKLEKKIKLPFLQDGQAVNHEVVLIPHDNVFGQNQLQLQYYFDYSKQGPCKDVFLNNDRGAIDDDTSIDFSAFPHYTAMPNVSFFVNDGFPYTKMADLSETAVVMPDNPLPAEIETYLMVMGRMGKATGYPAIRHVLVSAAGVEAHENKDLILIGTAGNQPLLERWADKMHPLLVKGTHTLMLPGPIERLRSRWQNRDLEDAMRRAGDLITKGESGLGSLVAFESPLKRGRSVVAFTGDDADQIAALAVSMSNPKMNSHFNGDLVLQSGKRIEGFQMGPTYYVGSLPWLTAIYWFLSKQPLALIIFIGLASWLVAIVAFRFLRKMADKRLRK